MIPFSRFEEIINKFGKKKRKSFHNAHKKRTIHTNYIRERQFTVFFVANLAKRPSVEKPSQKIIISTSLFLVLSFYLLYLFEQFYHLGFRYLSLTQANEKQKNIEKKIAQCKYVIRTQHPLVEMCCCSGMKHTHLMKS